MIMKGGRNDEWQRFLERGKQEQGREREGERERERERERARGGGGWMRDRAQESGTAGST
uniref:Uncharacterized protein n=1 Tax=Anguilla anguilla TaxID=7936 RepID=A0A0E9WJ39_ANGAN